MVSYTVRIDILKERQAEWEAYMMHHIKAVLNTGHFVGVEFKKFEPALQISAKGEPANPAFAQYDMDSNMRMVFYPAVIGWILFSYWLFEIKNRISFIKNKLHD